MNVNCWLLILIVAWVGCCWYLQDDAFTESYITTIGVDFVS